MASLITLGLGANSTVETYLLFGLSVSAATDLSALAHPFTAAYGNWNQAATYGNWDQSATYGNWEQTAEYTYG